MALLEGLTPEEWQMPAIAGGWTVHDVALHLLGDDAGILSSKRDGYRQGFRQFDNWQELVDFINESNAKWVEGTRRISPRLLCQLLRLTGEEANRLFASLDLFATGGAVDWAGSEPAPVWLDVAREFTERWHHQQHIREAVGKPGAAEPYFLAPVLAAFVHALPVTYREVDAPRGTSVTLRISGPAGATWTVIREENGWVLFSGAPERPDAALVLPEDTAWRLFTHGIGADEARSAARFEGSRRLAEQALQTISIIA